jgi:hypothetical protein
VTIPWSQTIQISSGTAPFTVTALKLPAGLSVTSGTNSFTISGTPAKAGNFSLRIQIQDATQTTEIETFPLAVYSINGPLYIAPAWLPDGNLDDGYSQSLTLVNGSGAVTWSVSGQLPIGLLLDSSGNLSGQLMSDGTFSFTVQAVDATGAVALQSYTINVFAPSSAPSSSDTSTNSGTNTTNYGTNTTNTTTNTGANTTTNTTNYGTSSPTNNSSSSNVPTNTSTTNNSSTTNYPTNNSSTNSTPTNNSTTNNTPTNNAPTNNAPTNNGSP